MRMSNVEALQTVLEAYYFQEGKRADCKVTNKIYKLIENLKENPNAFQEAKSNNERRNRKCQ